MDKTLSAVFALVMIVAVAGMVQAQGPQYEYTCPICDEVFPTYDELYQHFINEHPSEPITIIWE